MAEEEVLLQVPVEVVEEVVAEEESAVQNRRYATEDFLTQVSATKNALTTPQMLSKRKQKADQKED